MQLNTKLVVGTGALGLAAAVIVAVTAAPTFVPDSQPIGYVGQPVPSSTNVATGTARMFAIDYKSSDWSGNLHAYPISTTGAIGGTDTWVGGAEKIIGAQATRLIVTLNDAATPSVKGLPFTWANMSTGASGRRVLLDPDTAAITSTTSPVVDYLRGSKANEGTTAGKFRPRSGALGDIIHSTPVYWDDGTNKTVFIGANDGMMHAIDAVTGAERFAYIPGAVIPKLRSLTDRAYTHKYYVDGRLDVRKFPTKTVLVGTLGGGGQAFFGLDVTNAAATSEADAASKVLWEVTNKSTGFASLGYTYGAPVLAKLPNNPATLVIGNGYNNTGTGTAILYVVNALTGDLIKAMDTGNGSTSAPNGLSSPSLWDIDGDGVTDVAYAGDIDGNLWKFDLADLSKAPVLLQARESGNDASHAITSAPGVTSHPLGGAMVQFVTGRMLTEDDAKDTAVQYAYGIWDGAPSTNSGLVDQVLTEETYGSGAAAIRVRRVTSKTVDYSAGKNRGWRTALPTGGERLVGDGAFVTGKVFQFFSTNPTISPDAKPPGENWWMQLNWLTGGGSNDILFDLNDDNNFTSDDTVTVDTGGTAVTYNPVGRHMGGGVRSQLVGLSAGGVDVFQSNFDQNGAPKPDESKDTIETVSGERGVSGGHFDTDIFCYKNCGGLSGGQAWMGGAQSVGGAYGVGRAASTGDGASLNYIHVHEYDDIYDVLGLNMLHPSQDTQRLSLVRATTSSAHVPDTPSLVSSSSYASTAVVLGTPTVTIKQSNRTVNNTINYTYGARTPVDGYPQTVADGTGRRITTKVTYQTKSTSVVNTNYVPNGRNYNYTETRTIRTWDTVLTTVDTVPNTKFKVLMANQGYSPAVKFTIAGPDAGNVAYDGSVINYQTGGGVSASALPTYSMNTISALTFAMPLDAFNIQDWGTGIKRNGLHPIMPQCAGVSENNPTLGPAKEWRNGALTVQIVQDDVTDADLQLNVTGKPGMGYRLKTTSMASKLVAEYLIYWHHPQTGCMADANWTMQAEPDNKASTAKPGVAAAGAQDPHGTFQHGNGGTTIPPMPANPVPVVVVNADGSKTTTTITYTPLSSGGYTKTTNVTTTWPSSAGGTAIGIVTGGAVYSGGSPGDPPGESKCLPGEASCMEDVYTPASALGRINWREMQR